MIRRTVLSGTAVIALIAAGMVAVSGPALAADTATINGATTYQTTAGFGASEAFGEANTVMNLPYASRPVVDPVGLPGHLDQQRRRTHGLHPEWDGL